MRGHSGYRPRSIVIDSSAFYFPACRSSTPRLRLEEQAGFPPTSMEILGFLLIGLLAGWIAGEVMKGHGFGMIGDIVVGVIGAFIGGFLFNALGITAYGFIGSLVMAVIGAVVLLFLISLIKRA